MTALTSLANVKSYLAVTSAGSDALISALIPRESAYAERWLGVTLPRIVQTNKRLSGYGGPVLVLPDTPIISVSSVSVDGTPIAESSDGILAAGYTYEPGGRALVLVGSVFPRGRLNVTASWVAGYQTSETANVPASNTPTLTPTEGGFASINVGVTNAAGANLVQVSGTPAVGEYAFAAGTYTFNTGNANESVTMTYGYVPGPIEQAVIEMIGLDMKQRDNLGVTSKSLAGETVSYSDKNMTASVREMLWPYRRMVPV